MENLEIKSRKVFNPVLIILAVCAILFSSCDLKLQKEIPFNPESPTLVTFKDQTVWDWLQTHPKDDFNYMVQAINVTGLQNLYSQVDTQRTYLLLKDAAFTSNTGVLKLITGSTTGDLSTLSPENTQRLKNLLLYHIISIYVDQGPDNLKSIYKNYFFQTLLPGPQGIISINRNENFKMIFNTAPSLPSTRRGTSDATPTLHNYIFKNGVAHLLPVYLCAYPF